MLRLSDVIHAMHRQEWLMLTDLRDAYSHVSITHKTDANPERTFKEILL